MFEVCYSQRAIQITYSFTYLHWDVVVDNVQWLVSILICCISFPHQKIAAVLVYVGNTTVPSVAAVATLESAYQDSYTFTSNSLLMIYCIFW